MRLGNAAQNSSNDAMKRLLVICLCLWAVFAQALNLPKVSTENLVRFEDGLKWCRANGVSWVRVNPWMANACRGSTIETYALERAGQLCAQYGVKVVFTDETQLPNTKCVRAMVIEESPLLIDAQVWQELKDEESRGVFQDLHNLAGIKYPSVALRISGVLLGAFEAGLGRRVDVLQNENEPGNVVNSRLDPTKPYGFVGLQILDFLRTKVLSLYSSRTNLASPAWETEAMAGLMEQIKAEDKGFWGRFSYQSLNWYLTKWNATDTPSKWAKRAVAEIKAFIKDVWWPGRTVLISEIAAIGCPKELRAACLKSLLSNKPSSWLVCWWDWDSLEFGL